MKPKPVFNLTLDGIIVLTFGHAIVAEMGNGIYGLRASAVCITPGLPWIKIRTPQGGYWVVVGNRGLGKSE